LLDSQSCLDFLTFSISSIWLFRNSMKNDLSEKAGFLRKFLKAVSS